MIKRTLLYLLILFPALLFSQKQTQEFIYKKDSLLPGTATSVSFPIENDTSVHKVYNIGIESSTPYITPITTKDNLSIEAGEQSLFLVSLRIASEIPKGTYTLTIRGTDKNNPGNNEFVKTLEIVISEQRKLSLTSLNTPEFVKAGEKVTSTFLLKNNGNVTENLTLACSQNTTMDIDPKLILQPGESKIVTVSKTTDPKLGKNEYLNLNLSARSANAQNLTAYSTTRIISVNPVEDDIYYRFPVSASVSFIGMRNRGVYNNGFQGEIYGKGSLSKENRDILEFRAVTANPVEFSAFTQYEEYYINYKNDNLFFHIGDKTYSSSFLTEFARYGRGAELRYDFKNISIGGFYNHPRFFRDIKDEFNIYTKLRFRKTAELTAGYLYKTPQKDNTGPGMGSLTLDSNTHLPYLTGKLTVLKNIELQGEFAYSKNNITEGTGYLLQAQANYAKVSGNIMYMRASPKFAGYFNNTSNINGNLQYRFSNKFNVFASYIQDAKNFQRDTLLMAAPYRKFFQYGLNYRYMKTGNIMFYNGFQKYEDRLPQKQFNYNEKFFKISIDQQIGIFQLNLEGQFGKTDNYLTGFSGNSSFYTANISFEKFKTSFNLFGSYGLTSRYLLQNQRQIYYGARITSRFTDHNYLSIFYQNNYIPEEYFKDRNLFEVLFHQRLFRNHDLDISGRYALQRGELGNKDFIFSLRYTLRMNIPIQKIAEYTTLTGHISNLGVKKTDGIRLMLGTHLSVTDKDGNFSFKNIVPGDYFLEIDRSTTNLDDISDINLPAAVSLTNKENIFNFGLTGASNIRGHVRLNEIDKDNQPVSESSKPEKKGESIIIEASSGDQVYRKMCAIGEDFSFTYLRPGEWTVKLYRNGLNKRYKIASDNFRITLKASETKEININITKQQTEVRYQQEAIKVEYNETKKTK